MRISRFAWLLVLPLPVLAQGVTSHSTSSVARARQISSTTLPANKVAVADTTMVPCTPETAVKRPKVHKRRRHVVHHVKPATPVVPVAPVNPASAVAKPVVHRKKHHPKPATAPKTRTVTQRMCPSIRTLAMGTPSAIVPEWTKALAVPSVEATMVPDVPMFTPLASSPVSGPSLQAPSSGHGIFGVAAIPAIFLLFLHSHGGSTEGAQPPPPGGGTPPVIPPGTPATVPEPGTWVLLGTGLFVLGIAARRRLEKES
jgi:hypothetical protein